MPLDPDIPWGWNLILFAIVALTPVVSLWLTNRKTKAKLHAMGEDIAASRKQVENEHGGTDFPNLRDEMSEIRRLMVTGFEDSRTDTGSLRSEVRDLRQDVNGLRTDARHDRREVTQRLNDLALGKT